MKLLIGICSIALLSCTFAAITQSPPTTISDGTTVTINPKLRKALLEALSNFEGEDSTESSDEATTITSEEIEDVTNNPAIIKVHSFSIDGDKSDENEIIKTIIISRPRSTLTPPKPDDEDTVQINFGITPDPVTTFADKSDNIVSPRSTNSQIEADKKEEKPKKKASEKAITKPVTPQTTTTTLPPPVTNADGENIEKVAKDGVKIFQAPLLAAFTVQQDINGQPNKVISLFKNPQQAAKDNKRIVNMEFRGSQPEFVAQSTQAPLTTLRLPNVNTQAPVEQQRIISIYEEKQRQLEEQIRFLQARQRDQEEFIRRHQILEQRLRFDEDQRRQQDVQQQQQQNFFRQQQQQQQQQIQSVPQPQTAALIAPPSSTNNVEFVQSIPVGHTVGISVEQQLPFKGPVEFNPDKPDFQKSLIQRQQQFQFKQFQTQQQNLQANQGFRQESPQIQKAEIQDLGVSRLPSGLELPVKSARDFNSFNHFYNIGLELPNKPAKEFNPFSQVQSFELPIRQAGEFRTFSQLPTNLELPQRPFQVFNSAPLNILPSLTDLAPQSEARNRVFRNDALQTGNFGFNSPNVQFQQQQLVPVDGTFDVQLQNLLAQSGIASRSAEDFRIISKVLALNHGVPNNFLLNNSGRFK
ncbi:hypothetical protein ACKWTF_013122 [Chironomus riparius]